MYDSSKIEILNKDEFLYPFRDILKSVFLQSVMQQRAMMAEGDVKEKSVAKMYKSTLSPKHRRRLQKQEKKRAQQQALISKNVVEYRP